MSEKGIYDEIFTKIEAMTPKSTIQLVDGVEMEKDEMVFTATKSKSTDTKWSILPIFVRQLFSLITLEFFWKSLEDTSMPMIPVLLEGMKVPESVVKAMCMFALKNGDGTFRIVYQGGIMSHMDPRNVYKMHCVEMAFQGAKAIFSMQYYLRDHKKEDSDPEWVKIRDKAQTAIGNLKSCPNAKKFPSFCGRDGIILPKEAAAEWDKISAAVMFFIQLHMWGESKKLVGFLEALVERLGGVDKFLGFWEFNEHDSGVWVAFKGVTLEKFISDGVWMKECTGKNYSGVIDDYVLFGKKKSSFKLPYETSRNDEREFEGNTLLAGKLLRELSEYIEYYTEDVDDISRNVLAAYARLMQKNTPCFFPLWDLETKDSTPKRSRSIRAEEELERICSQAVETDDDDEPPAQMSRCLSMC